MVINTGSRTDTVQYFSNWLLNRFNEGYVYVRNPYYQETVTRYELTPDVVDCVLFCSKNYKPILKDITRITSKFNTYFHYTITCYGKEIEPGVPSVEESMETLKELSEIVGKKRLSWRYDPIILTDVYTKEKHIEMFEKMAKELSPYIDRCIFSFVTIYEKLKENMPEIIPMTEEDEEYLLENMGRIAKENNMILQTCGMKESYAKYGIQTSGCATADILELANSIEFTEKKKHDVREGCNCIESREIGAYDTCLNGCKYCYANKNPEIAVKNYKLHNPNSPMIIGDIKSGDNIQQGVQKSIIKKKSEKKKVLDF